MWMTILKNAKGNFVELEKMLEGVDSKYLKGGFYFPRSDLPNNVYEELWAFIKKNMGRLNYHKDIHDKGGFDAYPQVNGNNDYSKTPENYAYSLKMRPIIPPTRKQASTWKGLLIRPETIAENWKNPEDFEEHNRRRNELNRLHDVYPDITVKHRWRTDSIEEDPKYTPYKKEYDEWVKENMKPDSEREDQFSTKTRMGNTIPSKFVGGGKLGKDSPIPSVVDKEAWKRAHTGYFILKVYHNKRRIINIDLKLDVDFKPPPRNPWSYGNYQKNKVGSVREAMDAAVAWRKYWNEYEAHQKTPDYTEQLKVQKALVAIFDMAQNYEAERSELEGLFE